MSVITFFNNKGGVGKTTLVYHIAWMMAEMGKKVLAVDLDPQSNLSSMFLTEARMEEILSQDEPATIYDAMKPVIDGEQSQPEVHVENIADNVGLIIGSLNLSIFEDDLSDAWNKSLGEGKTYALRLTKIFATIIKIAAHERKPDVVLVDVGPNFGAINRSAVIATDHVIIPVAPDLFSLQGIRNLGSRFKSWRDAWHKRREENKDFSSELPLGNINVAGYIVLQHNVRDNRPVKAYLRFAERIPEVYAKSILDQKHYPASIGADPHCLGFLKHYHSLLPMAMEARKPLFFLKPADGAIGAHTQAVDKSYQDFYQLSQKIISACD